MIVKYFDIRTNRYKIPRSAKTSALKETIEQLDQAYSTVCMLYGEESITALNLGGVIISLSNDYKDIINS